MNATENTIDSIMQKHDSAGDLNNLSAQSCAKMFDEIHDAMVKNGTWTNSESTLTAVASRMEKNLTDRGITKIDVSASTDSDGKIDNDDKFVVKEKGMIYGQTVTPFPVLELFDSAKDAPQQKPQPKPEVYTGSRADAEHGSNGFERMGDRILKPIKPEK